MNPVKENKGVEWAKQPSEVPKHTSSSNKSSKLNITHIWFKISHWHIKMRHLSFYRNKHTLKGYGVHVELFRSASPYNSNNSLGLSGHHLIPPVVILEYTETVAQGSNLPDRAQSWLEQVSNQGQGPVQLRAYNMRK